jgi:dynactin complex subunit
VALDLLEIGKNFGLPVAGAIAGWIFTSMKVKDRLRKVEQGLTALRKGWRLELDNTEAETQEKFEELRLQLKELQEKFHSWQRQSSSFATDEELARFIKEQQDQWQAIQRTLGQIEGMVKRLP